MDKRLFLGANDKLGLKLYREGRKMTNKKRKTIALTYDKKDPALWAIGWDAGNKNMKANNRKVWNADDWNVAAKTMNELLDEKD
jgi:hypothetical protein